MNDDQWGADRKYVLTELQRLNSNIEHLIKQDTRILVEIATLKGRAGAWGAIGGLVASIVAGILGIFLTKG